jgi:hypothetical protein
MNQPKRILIFGFLVVGFLILSCKLGGQAGPAPTSTIIPPTPIPGWEKFEGGGVELWLPANFDGGDLTNDLDVIIQHLRSLGPAWDKTADTIEQNPTAFVLWAFDTEIGSNIFLTNVNVTKDQVLSTITMDMYMEAVAKQVSPLGLTVIDQKKVRLENYDAGLIMVQSDELKAKEILYIIKDKNTIWAITYATGMDEFEARLPTFEKSANTFKIQP